MAEPDLNQLHQNLIELLRKKQLFRNEDVEAAFSAVPRHLFLPSADPQRVYQDQAIALKVSRGGETTSSASQPTMMAIMLDQLELSERMNVLEIGTASGYNAALMRQIVGEQGRVTSLEIDRDLIEQAQEHLFRAGYPDVLVVHRDAAAGYEPRAQYDRIIATAGVWDLPASWLRQLREDGSLVAPIWLDGVQVSAAFKLQPDGSWLSRDNRPCAFVYLQGLAAGPQVRKRVGSSSLEILADDVAKVDTAALHLLLSDEQEIYRLGGNLQPEQFWFGLQLYLMLHEPPDYVFAVFAIPDGETAYGMQGNGILLSTSTSVALAPYEGGGAVHSFGSTDAFMQMEALFRRWRSGARPLVDRIRLRLTPRAVGLPSIECGKVYQRKDHFLHVWLD